MLGVLRDLLWSLKLLAVQELVARGLRPCHLSRAAVHENARMMARDTQRTIVNNDSRPLTCHHKGRFEQAYIDLAEGLPDGKPVDPNEHAASLWPAGDY